MRVLISFLVVFSGCAASQKQLAGAHLARFETLDVILANARSSTCLQGLEPIPATVIDVGIFKNVPYQSFSNGLLEFNAYGDPSNLVAVEAGTKEQDEALKSCIVQFLSQQTLSAADGARVGSASLRSHSETTDGLTVETTTADAADAYGAWWLSLELTGDVPSAAASSTELATITTPSSSWSGAVVTTDSSRRSSYKAPKSAGGPVFVHSYVKKNGTYVQSHTRRR